MTTPQQPYISTLDGLINRLTQLRADIGYDVEVYIMSDTYSVYEVRSAELCGTHVLIRSEATPD